MADTQFKTGSKGRFLLPVGSEVVNSNGYLLRKVQHTGRAHRDWRLVHLLLWEEHLGSVPPGHCITFKNERKDDIRIDNLACISRSERMKRNSYWTRYPKEIARLIQLRGQLSRVINKRERNAAKHS